MRGIYQQLQEKVSKNPPPKKITRAMIEEAVKYIFNGKRQKGKL